MRERGGGNILRIGQRARACPESEFQSRFADSASRGRLQCQLACESARGGARPHGCPGQQSGGGLEG
eukprot:4334633-Pyramimonas_sp.AAC.1